MKQSYLLLISFLAISTVSAQKPRFFIHKTPGLSIDGIMGLNLDHENWIYAVNQAFVNAGISTTYFADAGPVGFGLSSNYGYLHRYSRSFVNSRDEYDLPVRLYPGMEPKGISTAFGICPIAFGIAFDKTAMVEIRPLIELSKEKLTFTVVDSVHNGSLSAYIKTFQQPYRKVEIANTNAGVLKVGFLAIFGFTDIMLFNLSAKYRVNNTLKLYVPDLSVKVPHWEVTFGLSLPLKNLTHLF